MPGLGGTMCRISDWDSTALILKEMEMKMGLW